MPIIESNNNPKARSNKNALGLWQFISATASDYNLSNSAIIDERTDVLKSTYAAAAYLKYLYGLLNDWNLVLAAYNCGPGFIKAHINNGLLNKNGKLDLEKLPIETQDYLIKFYAYNQAIQKNFNNPLMNKYPNKEYILKIDRENLNDYLYYNKNVSEHLLEYINGYNIFKITFKKSILVPAPIFKDFFSLNKINVKNYDEKKVGNKINPSKCIMHVAQYHETFSSIAKTYTVNSRELINSNPSVRFLRPGVTLNICAV